MEMLQESQAFKDALATCENSEKEEYKYVDSLETKHLRAALRTIAALQARKEGLERGLQEICKLSADRRVPRRIYLTADLALSGANPSGERKE